MTARRKYFGTDGIRGRVGEPPITADFMLKLGWAAGSVFARHAGQSERHKVLIGKDTRISGYMFESALEAGFSAAGINIALTGPMPTPAVAYLARTLNADAGVVISASHNPFYDNGIKFFSAQGQKLPDEMELEIEHMLDQPIVTVAPENLGKARRVTDAAGRYIEFCKSTAQHLDLDGLNIVVDCANGATYHIAPNVFTELGAKVEVIGTKPDGININVKCGSTHPEALAKRVVASQADLGVAFDGDGDRLIMVDRHGQLIEGDQILYLIAQERQQHQPIHAVVGTLMTNIGLEVALQKQNIRVHRAKVGDRYVMEKMVAEGLLLGAENSGHVICLDRTTTGDGIVAALQVLTLVVRSGKPLDELLTGMQLFPQALVNVNVKNGAELVQHAKAQAAIQQVEQQLGSSGRVLVRASGTEPLVRVMVEGKQKDQIHAFAEEIAEVIRNLI